MLGDLGIRARALNSAFKMLNGIKLSLPEASISIMGEPLQRGMQNLKYFGPDLCPLDGHSFLSPLFLQIPLCMCIYAYKGGSHFSEALSIFSSLFYFYFVFLLDSQYWPILSFTDFNSPSFHLLLNPSSEICTFDYCTFQLQNFCVAVWVMLSLCQCSLFDETILSFSLIFTAWFFFILWTYLY